jgi:Uma2 family endonuclease
MTVQIKRYTVEEFDNFVHLPENSDKRFEFIRGEVVEVVSNNYSSEIAARINGFLFMYLQKNPIGRLTGADGGYQISGERYIPDVAFISKTKQPKSSHAAYNPNTPDLVVEVLSPTDTDAQMRVKVTHYLLVKTTVWIVDPAKQQVEVYIPGRTVTLVGIDGALDGGEMLPGFTLAIKDVFPET